MIPLRVGLGDLLTAPKLGWASLLTFGQIRLRSQGLRHLVGGLKARSSGGLAKRIRLSSFQDEGLRPLLGIAAAVTVFAGGIAPTAGIASAKTVKVDATNYSAQCTTIAGTMRFLPPLTNSASTSETVKIRATLSGCSTPNAPSVTLFDGRLRGTLAASEPFSCSSLGGTLASLTGGLAVSWTSSPKLASGKSVLSPAGGSLQGIFGPSPFGLQIVLAPSSPEATGSFTGGDSGSLDGVSFEATQPEADIQASCSGRGLREIDIVTAYNHPYTPPAAILQ